MRFIYKTVASLTVFLVICIISFETPGQLTVKVPKVVEVAGPAANGSSSEAAFRSAVRTSTSSDCQLEGVLLFLHNELTNTTKRVSEYVPGKSSFLVIGAQAEWLLRAVSPKERETWSSEWLKTDCAKEKFGEGFAALSSAASEKLPIFVPAKTNFTNKNPREEKMMKDLLQNKSSLEIYSSGLYHSIWQIDANSLGIPRARYKQGYMWVRDKNDDHPYCHLYQVNVIQDYAGGGRYGATYARFIKDALFGCKTQ